MIRVSTASDEEQPAALELLFSRLPAEERRASIESVSKAAENGEQTLDGLLVASQEGEPVGAVLFLMQPDGTAYVFAPCAVAHRSPAEICDALLQEVRHRIVEGGAWIGQCILDPAETADREVLSRNGFWHLADLRYLHRPLSEPLPECSHVPLEAVSWDPHSEELQNRFAELIERTWVGTQDCPELNGLRSGAEALESHRLTGTFRPELWTLYRGEGRDAGLLLFGDHPEEEAWEVAYMGVAGEFRGRGLGREMLARGMRAAQAAGRKSILLAVDARNRYAAKTYEELGFEELAVRSIHAVLCRGGG